MFTQLLDLINENDILYNYQLVFRESKQSMKQMSLLYCFQNYFCYALRIWLMSPLTFPHTFIDDTNVLVKW